jgi:hypothetical protein
MSRRKNHKIWGGGISQALFSSNEGNNGDDHAIPKKISLR